MKYETQYDKKSGSYSAGQEVTISLTYTNNVDRINFLYIQQVPAEAFRILSTSISGNVLTIVLKRITAASSTSYIFTLATVATY